MADKELAEKVAEYLGYKLVSDCWWEKLEERPNSNKIPDYELEEYIFSWPTFGLIIEKAEEMGWDFYCSDRQIAFVKYIGTSEAINPTTRFIKTQPVNTYIKATALAFLEIFDK